jgi:YYY domain-containing protein
MFMNSIWVSATFPPQDAWLAGYGISYYYLGYWLVTTIGRIANIAPNLAYNLAQATWYGLLWLGCLGVVGNLLAWRLDRVTSAAGERTFRLGAVSLGGGILAGAMVALMGNLWAVVEWLYAQGVNVTGLAAWVDVDGFPERASQSGAWYIGYEWWWWRTSRVVEDLDLVGGHIEVIDEFPMFSYLLGDNHPHVLAMPVVLLVVAAAFALLIRLLDPHSPDAKSPEGVQRILGRDAWLVVPICGSLVFLNTWDFPPYWVLLAGVVALGLGMRRSRWKWSGVTAGIVLVGTILVYLPYFLTAQSQAGGLIVNLFNPTRLPQFLLMFGTFLPAVAGVLVMGWQLAQPSRQTVMWAVGVVLGTAILILGTTLLVADSSLGQRLIPGLALPEGETSYAAQGLARWLAGPWTLLLTGSGVAIGVACLAALLRKPGPALLASADTVFVLLLVVGGLALVYVPEFVFLRDFFGTRMNTVFKFYYQAWMLFGLVSAYFVVVALRAGRTNSAVLPVLAGVTAVLTALCLVFPAAGIYSKTGGFRAEAPTLDATAYIGRGQPDVWAGIAWIAANTAPDARVLEGKGNSYSAAHSRVSALTGRPTLLGWEWHERQWRGNAYGEMAQGRPEALELIYRTGRPAEVAAALAEWEIEYVFIGPVEVEQYGITQARLDELARVMEPVFRNNQVLILRRRA